MSKKNIYSLLILPFILSCSDMTVEGEWQLSEDTIYKNSSIPEEINPYYKSEMLEKLASRVSRNTTYSFLPNGKLKISLLSEIDSSVYEIEGEWSLSGSKTLTIKPLGAPSRDYQFLFENNSMILTNLSDSLEVIILDKD